MNYCSFFIYSPEDLFIDLRNTGKGERERGREREERNIDQLPPVYTLIGDQTCNLLVHGQCSNQLSHPARAVTVL